MASRALLHKNKQGDLEKWLEKSGYTIVPTSKNSYEVLRAKKEKNTVIVYRKADNKEHLSVMEKDYALIRKFITDTKKQNSVTEVKIRK